MKSVFCCCVALVLAALASAQTSPCNRSKGKELSQAAQSQFAAFLASSTDVAAVRFDMALHYAKLGNHVKALSTLEEALKDTPWLDPATEKDFTPISACSAFKALVAQIEKKYPVVAAAKPAFTIHIADYAGYAEYPQPHPPFEHAVSALDLLFCTGPKAIDYMKDVCPMLSIG